MSEEPTELNYQNLPQAPDIRQSLCHTLMAAAFMLLNMLNPFAVEGLEETFHSGIMIALGVVVFLSWFFFSRRLRAWRNIPTSIRSRVTRRPQDLKQRAISHLMMSLLAVTLTALALYAHLVVPSDRFSVLMGYLVLAVVSLVGIMAVAILSRTIRDLVTVSRSAR